MVHITDIDKINWLVDTDKALVGLRDTKKLGLSDCEFQINKTLLIQPNFGYPNEELKEIQREVYDILREEIELAIDKARDCIFYKLKDLGVKMAAGDI